MMSCTGVTDLKTVGFLAQPVFSSLLPQSGKVVLLNDLPSVFICAGNLSGRYTCR